MAIPRLSRCLGGIFALCYLSATIVIIWFSAFSASSTAMAEALVSVTPTPTPCPKSVPHLPGSFQAVYGTIKSVAGLTLQIVPKVPPVTPVNATYSSTTHITEQTLITTPPASVLLKGADVSILVTQNPNGTVTAALITLESGKNGCEVGFGGGRFAGGGPRPKPTSTGPDKKPTVPKKPNPNTLADSQLGIDCFANRGPAPKSTPAVPSPTPNANKRGACRPIVGTVEQLNGNNLTVIDRQHTSHVIVLTTGANGTKIIKDALVTASALKVGALVTVSGPATKGVIAATEIAIVPALPPA